MTNERSTTSVPTTASEILNRIKELTEENEAIKNEIENLNNMLDDLISKGIVDPAFDDVTTKSADPIIVAETAMLNLGFDGNKSIVKYVKALGGHKASIALAGLLSWVDSENNDGHLGTNDKNNCKIILDVLLNLCRLVHRHPSLKNDFDISEWSDYSDIFDSLLAISNNFSLRRKFNAIDRIFYNAEICDRINSLKGLEDRDPDAFEL